MKKVLLLMFAFVVAAVNMVAQTTVTFDATADKTANSVQANNETLTKGGVTVVISQGVMGNGTDYRCYKNQTLTVSSTTGNVQKVVFTCTANGAAKYGPGSFGEQEGYTFEAEGHVGTWTGDAASVEFKASANQVRMTKIEVTVSGEGGGTTDPDPGTDPDTKVTLFSESFGANLGDFTTDNVTMDEPLTYVWSYGGANYGAKASAFVNKTNYATESWLISPVIDLTKATECELSFEQAANFFQNEDNFKAACSVKVKAEGGNWEDLGLDAYPDGKSWTFITSTADLKAYDGKKVQVAFVYTSTETMAGTWELKNLVVKGKTDEAPVVVNAPTFEPQAGTYTEKVTVTLSAEEGMNIYYTLDGTKPTTASTLYTAPFDLTETTTVMAIAANADGVVSNTAVAKYEIEQPAEPDDKVALFTETFGANLGDFTTDDVTMDEPLTFVWSWGGANYGAKASAFVNKTNYAAESWLVSPVVDLTKATECEMVFEQAANFFQNEDNFKAACSVKVKAEGGEWTNLSLDAYPNGKSWTFVTSTADLKAYDGKKVQVAFVYTSTEEMAGTWEVKNLVVKGKTDVAPVVVNAPTFAPEAGTYKDKVTVSLSADEGLSIYYTLDGTKPGKESTLYTAPFDLTETTTVTAVAIDADGNESENVAAKYIIKQSPVAPENGVIFDFNANKWDFEISTQENTVPVNGPIVEGDVTLTFTDGSTPTRMWNDYNEGTQIRMYKSGGSAHFTCAEGKKLVKIEFNASKFDVTASEGELAEKVWTGESSDVTFTANATTNINYILVTLGEDTGIEGVEANGNTETVIYSLDGRRLQKVAKGVNIVNGKKVLVK